MDQQLWWDAVRLELLVWLADVLHSRSMNRFPTTERRVRLRARNMLRCYHAMTDKYCHPPSLLATRARVGLASMAAGQDLLVR